MATAYTNPDDKSIFKNKYDIPTSLLKYSENVIMIKFLTLELIKSIFYDTSWIQTDDMDVETFEILSHVSLHNLKISQNLA